MIIIQRMDSGTVRLLTYYVRIWTYYVRIWTPVNVRMILIIMLLIVPLWNQ